MPELIEARAAALGPSVSDIFNQELKVDRDQALKVATIISRDPNFNRPPDYYINIFNISPLEFTRHRPVDFPTIKILGCPKGQPYVLSVRVANVINYKWVSADTGQPSFSSIRGERWATDLINPANLGEDIWAETVNGDMDQFHGAGDDLSRRGVFWSRNDVPTADELRKCRSKMERHYRSVVESAEKLARKGHGDEIGDEAHVAADYLGVSAPWHVISEVSQSCPNCGDPIKSGVAFHPSALGPCIIDWERTVAAGVKKREDVPIEKRWWVDEGETETEKRGPGRPRKIE